MTGDQIVVGLLVAAFLGFIVYLAIRSRSEDRASKAAAGAVPPAQTPKAEVPPPESSKPLRKAS
jgi:hypothetical protein